MASGSLTIGGTNADYGPSVNWQSNTAGLMMECPDYTEICLHDSGSRVVSFMYYDGPNNRFIIGRDKGWGIPYLTVNGTVVFKNESWLLSGEYNNFFLRILVHHFIKDTELTVIFLEQVLVLIP